MKQIYIALEDGTVYGTNRQTALSDISIEKEIQFEAAEVLLNESSLSNPVKLNHCDYWIEEADY